MRHALLFSTSADVTVIHMARCADCDAEIPFEARIDRDVWVGLHVSATKHEVSVQTMIRVDTHEPR